MNPGTRSDQARRRALEAAAELIRDRGVPAFTVDEVARRSGVAKTTIYRHWDNGNALLVDAVDEVLVALPTPNTGDLKQDLREFVSAVNPAAGDPTMLKTAAGLLYAKVDDAELHAAVQTFAQRQQTPLRTMVQLAQARGDLPATVDLDLAVDLIEGPLMFRILFRQEPLSGPRLERLLDMVIAGLRS